MIVFKWDRELFKKYTFGVTNNVKLKNTLHTTTIIILKEFYYRENSFTICKNKKE
jgi:hypothetical protein